METIKRFVECLIPVTQCNLRCSYCYVIQENRRNDEVPNFNYTPEHIGRALSSARLGGVSFISICGAGETLIPKATPEIVEQLLLQGHYVNVTTNGTLSKRFDELVAMDYQLLKRLHFSFSFHYLELIRTDLLDVFFENIQKVKKAGCSLMLQLNLCDEYIPYLSEIVDVCKVKVGAAPQVAATRDMLHNPITLLTSLPLREYVKCGGAFHSALFNFTIRNFMVKRTEFCYAGLWSFVLNLCTGQMKQCYASPVSRNIFKDVDGPLKLRPIGNNCRDAYCANSSHFMSLGVIPSIATPSYAALRDREGARWMTPMVKQFLEGKLSTSNHEFGAVRKACANCAEMLSAYLRRYPLLRRIVKRCAKWRKEYCL